MNSKQSVFLSYSHADTDIMQRVKTSLLDAELQVWTDENLPTGALWQREIEKTIEGSDSVVVVLSPSAKDSTWVRIEVSYANVFEKEIYPILARGDQKTSIPIVLIDHQYIDITNDKRYEEQIRKLVIGIKGIQNLEKQPNRVESKPQAEYNLWLKHRWEDFQQELHEAEIHNDVAAFIKAQEAYEKDLKLQEIDLKIASLDLTLEDEFFLRRKKIMLNLKFEWKWAEANNNVQEFIAAQHSAEKAAWRLEDEYETLRGGLNPEIVENRLYDEFIQFIDVGEADKVSEFDLGWFLLLRPTHVEKLISKLIANKIIDPNDKQPHSQGGWEYRINKLPSNDKS